MGRRCFYHEKYHFLLNRPVRCKQILLFSLTEVFLTAMIDNLIKKVLYAILWPSQLTLIALYRARVALKKSNHFYGAGL